MNNIEAKHNLCQLCLLYILHEEEYFQNRLKIDFNKMFLKIIRKYSTYSLKTFCKYLVM